MTDDHEVDTIVRTLSTHSSSQSGGGGRGSQPTTPYTSYSALAKSSSAESWSTGGVGVGGGLGASSVSSSNLWPSSVLSGTVWGAPDDQHNRTTPLNSFLPPDLLSETM